MFDNLKTKESRLIFNKMFVLFKSLINKKSIENKLFAFVAKKRYFVIPLFVEEYIYVYIWFPYVASSLVPALLELEVSDMQNLKPPNQQDRDESRWQIVSYFIFCSEISVILGLLGSNF